MFLIQKYTQYKAAQAEQQKRKVTEKELTQLNHKIDKLLTKLDEHEPEIATNQDEECVVCVNAKATMQTYPCGHRVICRKCFVKTIQTAVAQRLLPLRCVICRAKILRLKHVNGLTDPDDETDIDGGGGGSVGSCGGLGAGPDRPQASSPTSASSSSSTSSATSALRQTISHWYKVPQSDSLYSVTSTASRASSTSCASTASSFRSAASSTFASLRKSHSTYSRMGYEQLRNTTSSPSCSPSPPSIRKILFPNASKKHQLQRQRQQQDAKMSTNMNTIPKSISISTTPMKDSAAISSGIKGISASRSSCQIHGQQQQRERQTQHQPYPPAAQLQLQPTGKVYSNKLPKKENRIVPVQAPKPMSMGLSPDPCLHPHSHSNNKNDRKSPASSPSSSTPSSASSSNNNLNLAAVTATPTIVGTPLKGKFRLVQEFQREFRTGREQCSPGKPHYHHQPEGLSNRTVAIGGKFRCSRPSQPRPCHCRDGSGNVNGSGRPATAAVGFPKDRSIHSISSCVAAIPSSSSSSSSSTNSNLTGNGNGHRDDVPRCLVPSSQSCPSFKQVLRPPPHSRCHSHYHHHRCGGCGTDKLRKLETLIEVK